MKLCKDFLKPGLPAVRCMVRFPVPLPAYPRPTARRASRPPGGFRGRSAAAPYAPAFGRGGPAGPPPPHPPAASPPAPPKPALPHLPPGRSPPPSGRLGGPHPPRRLRRRGCAPPRTFRRGAARRRGCAPRTNQLHAQTTPIHSPAAHPPPQGALPCGNGPDGLRPSRRLRRRPCGGAATRPAPFSP